VETALIRFCSDAVSELKAAAVAWSDVAWSDVAWADVAWADNATDPAVGDAADATSTQQDAAFAELGIVDATCDPTISVCTAPVTGGLLP